MEQHYGQIVEKVIRRNGYSISQLATLTDVNRRSVYNWFNQKRLKTDIIYRIGVALRHDFSDEFPELFPNNTFTMVVKRKNHELLHDDSELSRTNEGDYWKNKYIMLLEKYNEELTRRIA